MLLQYHVSITRNAVSERISPRAREAIIAANLKQDHLLTGQVGHDEYHYDNNAIAESDRYLEAQRALTISALKNDDPPAAWAAFGRLLHTAQDFYAHSNYVDLWLARFIGNGQTPPPPSKIEPLMDELVHSPELHSGRIYLPWELLSFIPGIKHVAIPLLPEDSHARMQIDSPASGKRFDYAYEAAIKRTRYELDKTVAGMTDGQEALFMDLGRGDSKVS